MDDLLSCESNSFHARVTFFSKSGTESQISRLRSAKRAGMRTDASPMSMLRLKTQRVHKEEKTNALIYDHHKHAVTRNMWSEVPPSLRGEFHVTVLLPTLCRASMDESKILYVRVRGENGSNRRGSAAYLIGSKT